MDQLKEKIPQLLQKYKYAALILLLGILLMALPDLSKANEPAPTEPAAPEQQTVSLSDELESILGQIDGAGRVSVMLTLASGEETLYQTDSDDTASSDSSSGQSKTVIITDAQRAQTGLVRQVNPARYQGAVIVCEGADSPTVRLAVVEAVSKATGLGADSISVLKMK